MSRRRWTAEEVLLITAVAAVLAFCVVAAIVLFGLDPGPVALAVTATVAVGSTVLMAVDLRAGGPPVFDHTGKQVSAVAADVEVPPAFDVDGVRGTPQPAHGTGDPTT